ncbi:MAG TPA: hypothetical protein VFT34_01960 [Verrucomicrobiae bacterium]|nr:hypothetical protein [Verrucomicrobiae bacterium]
MKLHRLAHDPARLIDFFEEGLTALGAVCDRSWHDRLELVAEGRAASLWNPAGEFVEKQLRFVPADATAGRDAETEVFPGCPLAFRLAEALRAGSLQLERVALQPFDQGRAPARDAVEKLWHAQFPACSRWQLERPFQSTWHFSLLLLARCELQAIDQHWSLHRLALSFCDGRRDDSLAEQMDFAQANPRPDEAIDWPALDLALWQEKIGAAFHEELTGDLAGIRARQESYLRRELDRVDAYFENYEREMQQRATRSRSQDAQLKLEQRLTAARAEHERRRGDQVQRHEIRIIPHLDALLVIAEPAWAALVCCQERHQDRRVAAHFLPRTRRWFLDETVSNTDRGI